MEFSSEGFHASCEQELSDAMSPDAIRNHIHDAAVMLRQAVEDELNGKSTSEVGGAKLEVYDRRRDPGATSPNSPALASPSQLRFINDLARAADLTEAQLTENVREAYGIESVRDLDKRSASKLITELKSIQRKAA